VFGNPFVKRVLLSARTWSGCEARGGVGKPMELSRDPRPSLEQFSADAERGDLRREVWRLLHFCWAGSRLRRDRFAMRLPEEPVSRGQMAVRPKFSSEAWKITAE